MVLAAFAVKSGDRTLQFTISTFEGGGGSDLENLNRWLRQLGRPPADDVLLEKLREKVKLGLHEFLYFDLSQNAPTKGDKFLTAILREGNRSWFFKLAGPANELKQEEPKFKQFLSSFRLQGDPQDAPEPDALTKTPPPSPPTTVPRLPDPRFTAALSKAGGVLIPAGGNLPPGVPPPPRDAPPPPPGGFPKPPPIPPSLLKENQQQAASALPPATEPGQPETPENGNPQWIVPEGWKTLPPSAFRKGNFLIQDENGVSGEVTVVPLNAGAGSLDANILRWGRKIGLAPESVQTEPPATEEIQISGKEAKYIILKGEEQGIHIGMVDHEDQTWFFKLKGPNALVSSQMDSFRTFLKSVKF